MVLAALIALSLGAPSAADRPVAVLMTSKRPGSETWAGTVAQRVHAQLEREGVPGLLSLEEGERQLKAAGLSDTRTCQAVRSCVAKYALILGPRAVVVSVDVARAANALAVSLDAVAADGARVLTSTELVLPIGGWSDQLVLPIVLFARELKAKLEAEAPAPAPDAPVVAQLAPVVTPPSPAVSAPAPAAKPPRVLPWVLLGAGIAGAGAGVTLAVLGAEDRRALEQSISTNDQGERVSSLTRSQLTALEQGGNAKLTAALISGIAAAALGIGTAVAFGVGN